MDQDFWKRHLFVLLMPDLVYRGRQRQFIERIHELGYSPVAARVVHSDPEMIDDLYADLIAGAWQTWRYRLVDASFGIGPGMALICRCAESGDPHGRFKKLKGHQHPEMSDPGTLRRDFDAVNSVVGVVHASDTPEESEREAGVFGLTQADAAEPSAETLARCCYLGDLLAGTRVPENRTFDDVLASVRARVLVGQWDSLDRTVQNQLSSVFADQSTLGAAGIGEKLTTLLAGALPDDLLTVLRCEYTPEWRDSMRMNRTRDVLRRHGVTLDPWEDLVLDTSLHFPPLRVSEGHA